VQKCCVHGERAKRCQGKIQMTFYIEKKAGLVQGTDSFWKIKIFCSSLIKARNIWVNFFVFQRSYQLFRPTTNTYMNVFRCFWSLFFLKLHTRLFIYLFFVTFFWNNIVHLKNSGIKYWLQANQGLALPGTNFFEGYPNPFILRYTKFFLPWTATVLEFGVPQGQGIRLAESCLC